MSWLNTIQVDEQKRHLSLQLETVIVTNNGFHIYLIQKITSDKWLYEKKIKINIFMTLTAIFNRECL